MTSSSIGLISYCFAKALVVVLPAFAEKAYADGNVNDVVSLLQTNASVAKNEDAYDTSWATSANTWIAQATADVLKNSEGAADVAVQDDTLLRWHPKLKIGALDLKQLRTKAERNPVKFFLYHPPDYEPRFEGYLKPCKRKGADYTFLERLMQDPNRVTAPEDADAFVVPCLFESFRRCTTTNHAEKPPPKKKSRDKSASDGEFTEDKTNHPEDYEPVPWVQALDSETERCLKKVMNTRTYKAHHGRDHIWVVADWAMNFGRTSESNMFKNMTIGRIEVVDQEAAAYSNRPKAVEQSRCSFVVPYSSDLSYSEKWARLTSFDDWKRRAYTVYFRFEDRQYVLWCQRAPCAGAPDATAVRRKSIELKKLFGKAALIEMERVPIEDLAVEMHKAKFCLVVRGDTPSTHALYDALAANCIPILISDKWADVALPFSHGQKGHLAGGIDPSAFTLQFTEKRWMEDLPKVAQEIKDLLHNTAKVRKMYESMLRHRGALLWYKPNSIASTLALHSAKQCLES